MAPQVTEELIHSGSFSFYWFYSHTVIQLLLSFLYFLFKFRHFLTPCRSRPTLSITKSIAPWFVYFSLAKRHSTVYSREFSIVSKHLLISGRRNWLSTQLNMTPRPE